MKKIAVFTSGGDSPGMNACIRAAVRTAVASNMEVFGIHRGYEGMIDNLIYPMAADSVSNIIQDGGTILKTARSARFMTPEGRAIAASNLKALGIEGLVCIGGDGSYTGANVLQQEHGIKTIGCPGTIDNDLFGTDYTIGFDTAVNTALEAIDKIRDTAESHNRIFFIEVMGRHSGHIALYSGIAGGAEGIFIPERQNELESIIAQYGLPKRQKAFSIFIVAEGDEEGHAYTIAKKFTEAYPGLDTRVSILGHIQRGGSPSANDRILATRLGAAAVLALKEGKQNLAAGIINNQVVFTPFSEAIGRKKDVPMELWATNELICS
jgi:6-phosphofructokinase 1